MSTHASEHEESIVRFTFEGGEINRAVAMELLAKCDRCFSFAIEVQDVVGLLRDAWLRKAGATQANKNHREISLARLDTIIDEALQWRDDGDPPWVSQLTRTLEEVARSLGHPVERARRPERLVIEAGSAGAFEVCWRPVSEPGFPSEVLVWVSVTHSSMHLACAITERLVDDPDLTVWGADQYRFVQPRSAMERADDEQLDMLLVTARDVVAGGEGPQIGGGGVWLWHDHMAKLLRRSVHDRYSPETIATLEAMLDVVPLSCAPRALAKLDEKERELACEDLALAYVAARSRERGFAPLSRALNERYPRFEKLRQQALPGVEVAVRELAFRGEGVALGLGAVSRERGASWWQRLWRRLGLRDATPAEVEKVFTVLQAGVATHLRALSGQLRQVAVPVDEALLEHLPREGSLRTECTRLIRGLP